MCADDVQSHPVERVNVPMWYLCGTRQRSIHLKSNSSLVKASSLLTPVSHNSDSVGLVMSPEWTSRGCRGSFLRPGWIIFARDSGVIQPLCLPKHILAGYDDFLRKLPLDPIVLAK